MSKSIFSGDEHIGTVYGVENADECQERCLDNLYEHGWCYFFTWYSHDNKCRLFTECKPSGDLCQDCVRGPAVCITTHTKSTLTTPNTSESPTSTEGTTTSMITTGQPVGECFTTGSCDISG